MWFTMTGPGTVGGRGILGRVTMDGVVTVRSLGDALPTPGINIPGLTGLTRAPDGSLWVLAMDHVLHVGADESVSSYPVPDGWLVLGKPAFGPDGNFWMVAEPSPPTSAGEGLFRMTRDAAFTPIALPPHWIDDSRMAAGPDGNLWVVAGSRRSVSRISPQGTVLEEIGVSDTPWDIMLGPDGRMWFSAGKSVGRIDV